MRKLMTHCLQNLIAVLTASSCLLLAGCQCNDERATTSKRAPELPAAPTLPADVAPDLLQELKTAAKSCETTQGQTTPTCNGSGKNSLILSFNKGDRKRIASLPTFVHALHAEDPQLQAIAAAVLYASFRTGFGEEANTGKVAPTLAAQLIQSALALPDPFAMQVIPAATHAAMLSGQETKLHAALNQDVPIQVRTMAYRHMMTYGRLIAFARIQELAKDPSAAVVLAATESPRNMADWTAEEQAAICPWAETFISDSRPAVAGNALAALSHCGGKHTDALLSGVEKVAREKQFSFVHATALRELCKSDGKGTAPSATQCGRLRTLQEKVAKDPTVHARVRAMVLATMANTFPDERTLSFSRKLVSSEDSEVARSAQQVVGRLSPSKAGPPKAP